MSPKNDTGITTNRWPILLDHYSFTAGAFAGVIEVEKAAVDDVVEVLKDFQADVTISAEALAESIVEKAIDKFDEYLPENLLTQGYGARAFDIDNAKIKTNALLQGIIVKN